MFRPCYFAGSARQFQRAFGEDAPLNLVRAAAHGHPAKLEHIFRRVDRVTPNLNILDACPARARRLHEELVRALKDFDQGSAL